MKKCHTVFQNGGTILHCQQQCVKLPISLYLCQYLVFSGFLIVAILMGFWFLVCISLTAKYVECLFICLSAICVYILWRNVYSNPLPILKLDYLIFYFWVAWGFFNIFCISVPYQIYDFQIFSPILRVVFSLPWRYHLQHKSF